MSTGGKIALCYCVGAAFALIGGYGVLDDLLSGAAVRSSALGGFVVGVILVFVGALAHHNARKARKAVAEAEAQDKQEADERIRKQIEAEAAELQRLRSGNYVQQVIRLTHCLTDEAQEGMGFYVEGMPLRLVGDEKNGDSIWVFNDITGCRIGQLPKEAAARVETVGAIAVYSERSEMEAGNLIPYVRMFWRSEA